MADLPDDDPRRALLTAAAAMVGVAVLVGLTVGGVLLGVVKASGIEGDPDADSQAPPSLFIPEYEPTPSASDDWNLPSASPSDSPGPGNASKSASPKTDRITLFVAPQAVSPSERINFNGVYVDGEGVELQIQRKEGGAWTEFPVQASVRGGSFETWIQTTRTGRQQFRVFDVEANRASNTVTVTVG